MPSPGFKPRLYGTVVSVTNHYIGWEAALMMHCFVGKRVKQRVNMNRIMATLEDVCKVTRLVINLPLATDLRKNTLQGILREKSVKSTLLKISVSLCKGRWSSRGNGDRFNNCQVNYSQFGLAIHQNDHQARRRFVEWAQNEIAVVPDFHKRILFSDEAHFWLNGYVNKQNCRIWSEANPQVYVKTPLHPEKLTVWCALWAGGILLQKR
ncbi:hypothetical protein TNCV_4168361 [Trichonephila clavipes]|nr:hypothetical protein TNCV_4168361 [Trichonephila clavipes]